MSYKEVDNDSISDKCALETAKISKRTKATRCLNVSTVNLEFKKKNRAIKVFYDNNYYFPKQSNFKYDINYNIYH